ncbi:hypothetical protein ACFUJ0_35000, partial [Streptomyces sp. NPDC057242]|uniref:hypothetical protein n=1 Tax=Streptomyces sp. NPDC057242 TaxID=3346063 RepID=UPI00362DEA29
MVEAFVGQVGEDGVVERAGRVEDGGERAGGVDPGDEPCLLYTSPIPRDVIESLWVWGWLCGVGVWG